MRTLAWSLTVVLVTAAPYFGCGDEHTHGAVGPERIVYIPQGATASEPASGGPSDETLLSVLGKSLAPGAAPTWISPQDGATLPRTPAAFSWRLPPVGPPDGGLGRLRTVPAPFGALRSAHAHGVPFTGWVSVLSFSDDTKLVLRVVTSETAITLDPESQDILNRAKSVRVELRVARVTGDVVDLAGGPFDAPPLRVTIR